jgi:flagellar protein FlaG
MNEIGATTGNIPAGSGWPGGQALPLPGTGQGTAPPPKSREPDPAHQQNARAMRQLEEYLQAHDQSVRFQVDQQTGLTVVHVYNKASGEVVRQIPTEVIVRIARFLQQHRAASTVDVMA